MVSFSLYPNNIDGYTTLPLRKDGVHEIRADDYNRLRDAIVKIEQELGIQPSGSYGTVRSRLDDVDDASVTIEAHLIDPTDAHDASAISILDSADNYVSTEVEGALSELAAVLPVAPNVIGANNTDIPNSGIPDFVNTSGILHVFNTGGGSIQSRTQPVNITGVHIIEVGNAHGTGTGAVLTYTTGPASLTWAAPGDSAGTAVDISSLSAGDVVTLESNDTTKTIRIARSSIGLPGAGPVSDTFDILRFDKKTGTYASPTDSALIDTQFATRAATSSTATSRAQFMIKGFVYPADKGTLVLQRKLRLASDTFTPVAVLDLGDNFEEALREDGQPVYTPALTNFDTITLFDRLPARKDYETLDLGTDGQVHENFDLAVTFTPIQVATYLIPISNATSGLSAELEAPTEFSASEIDNKVSAFRLVHYKTGITDFNGEPASDDIFSISDSFAGANDGYNNVRMDSVFLDDNTTRPGVAAFTLRPVSNTESTTKYISGIHYYNDSSDIFNLELQSDTNLFNNIFKREGILTLESDSLDFPSGVNFGHFGTSVDVVELYDDGYSLISDSNLPLFDDVALYILNASLNTSRRPTPASNAFSTNAFVTATFNDPFGVGTPSDAYGLSSDTPVRILINSYSTTRATNTQEWFTDESYRIGTAEVFDFALDVDQFTFEDGAGSNGTLEDWDQTAALSAGDLQCGGRFGSATINIPGLVFPQDNYDSAIVPTQDGSRDYSASAFEVSSIYQRVFSLGTVTNGGRLRIVSDGYAPLTYNDIDASNINRPLKIEVKVPGVGTNSTGFMDLGSLFETGQTEDGYGALAGQVQGTTGDFTIPFTFGVVNNADSGYAIVVRITYFATNPGILNDARSRIITMIQLLSP